MVVDWAVFLLKITFDTEEWDSNSAYDTSNGKFTVPSGQAGKYQVASVPSSSTFTITLPTGLTNVTGLSCSYGKRLFLPGESVPVTYTSSVSSALTSYLTHSNDEDIQTLSVNDTTFFTNRTKVTAMGAQTAPAKTNEIFIK